MKEQVFTFGPSDALIGTLTEPTQAPAAPSPPAVLLFNSGFIYRGGAHRLNVRLARAAARAGYAALRFDFSGFGDSVRGGAETPDDVRCAQEVVLAMDALQDRRVSSRFILVGLCSGTDHCFRAALQDERVVGVAVIDPFAYRTRRQRMNYWWTRVQNRLRNGRWSELVTARLHEHRKRRESSAGASASGDFFEYRRPPARNVFESWFTALGARGVRLFVAYSGDFPHWYNYREQFEEAHPALGGADFIELRYYHQANHTFTALALQEELLGDIYRWLAIGRTKSSGSTVSTSAEGVAIP